MLLFPTVPVFGPLTGRGERYNVTAMRTPQLPDDTLAYADRLFLAGLGRRSGQPVAQRAVQRATRLLALALGQSLRGLRESADPLLQAHACAREQSVLAGLFAELAELLGGRLDKLPERRRPHYTPAQRWRILEIKRLLALSAEETARLFRVCIGTVLRWEAEAGREPEKSTIGSLLKPTPPCFAMPMSSAISFSGWTTSASAAGRRSPQPWPAPAGGWPGKPSAATGTSRRSSRNLAEIGPIGPRSR